MKPSILALSALTLTACAAIPQQTAHWVTVCDADHVRYNFGALHSASIERMCKKDNKIPKIITAPGAFNVQLADVYYKDGGMIWVSPASESYSERTAGLHPAVFPHDTLAACVTAGDCSLGLAHFNTRLGDVY